MNNKLKQLAEILAQANDRFFERNTSVDTLMGIMDKTLRQQGMPADAITIDCPNLDKKIVFLLHDSKANSVNIAIGNKAGDIDSSYEQELDQFTVKSALDLIESALMKLPNN